MNVKALFTNVVRLNVDLIQEEVVQLRSEYDEEALSELGDSQDSEGMLYPIIVAPNGDNIYELIIGSRRLRSAKKKGASDIPAAIIEPGTPLSYLLMALAENIHREDLNPFEEARAFLRLMKDYGMGVQEVAQNTRKGEQFVRRRLELLSLPEEVQSMVAGKQLGLQFVTPLARIAEGSAQVHYAQKVIDNRLSLAELQTLIEREGGHPASTRQERKLSPEKVRVRIDMFTAWLKKVPRKSAIKQLNTDERRAISEALHQAEVEIRTLRALFTSGRFAQPRRLSVSEGNLVTRPRNDGSEWPSGDLSKIMAADRPSDEVLADQLGRTVGAIRGMRHRLTGGTKAARA